MRICRFSVEERHAYGQSIRNNLLETTHVLIQNLDEETRLIHAQVWLLVVELVKIPVLIRSNDYIGH